LQQLKNLLPVPPEYTTAN